MKLNNVTKKVASFISDNSQTILTGLGVAGVVTTAGLSTKAGIEIYKDVNSIIIDNEDARFEEICQMDEDGSPIYNNGYDTKRTAVYILKNHWKNYLPPVLVGATSIACIVGANTVSTKKRAALAGAYSLAQTTMTDYKDEVIEAVGKKKESDIHKKAAQKSVERHTYDESAVLRGEGGTDLFYDTWSGRYFTSDLETVRKIENDLNRELLADGFVPLSAYYHALGLPDVKIGEDCGWTNKHGEQVEFRFDSVLLPGGNKAAVSVDFNVNPNMDTDGLI